MYIFASQDGENGIFDDNGLNVMYFNSGCTNLSLLTMFSDGQSCLMIDHGGMDLDACLAGELQTELYKYNLLTGEREALFSKWKNRGQLGTVIMLSDDKFFVSEGIPGSQKCYITDFDGGIRENFMDTKGGYIYGIDLSPDKKSLSFHVAGGDQEFCPSGCYYAINTINIDGTNRKLVYAKPGHLMFGTKWTYDNKYILFNDCFVKEDPAHFFSDVCMATPDGSEIRYLTENQSHYFGTAYGSREHRGGGSNYPIPMPDGRVIYTYRTEGSWPDAAYRAELGNHKEKVFAPENARGGAYLVIHDLKTDQRIQVTPYEEGKWDFRPVISPDGKHVIYTTVRTASDAEVHMCKLDGSDDRLITRGHKDTGADYVSYIAYQGTLFEDIFIK